MGFNITDIVGGNVLDGVSKIIGLFKVPPEAQLAAQTELAKIQLDMQSKIIDQVGAQMEINKVEAASSSIFVAGWRPAIGWICGAVLAFQYIVAPLGTWLTALFGHPTPFPVLDMGQLMPILLGMLGMGALRSWDKYNATPDSNKVH